MSNDFNSTDYNNLYNYMVDVTCNVLLPNIDTLNTHNDTLNLLTNTNEQLTDWWTTGQPSATSSNSDEVILYNELYKIGTTDAGKSNEQQQANDVQTFLNTYIVGGTNPLPVHRSR